ncbi:MAG: hypothetical protein ACRYG8_05160 [Janthinobacterium lividum]
MSLKEHRIPKRPGIDYLTFQALGVDMRWRRYDASRADIISRMHFPQVSVGQSGNAPDLSQPVDHRFSQKDVPQRPAPIRIGVPG